MNKILAIIFMIVVAILGIIYFYKTKGSKSAFIYGTYATAIIIIFSLFLWKV